MAIDYGRIAEQSRIDSPVRASESRPITLGYKDEPNGFATSENKIQSQIFTSSPERPRDSSEYIPPPPLTNDGPFGLTEDKLPSNRVSQISTGGEIGGNTGAGINSFSAGLNNLANGINDAISPLTSISPSYGLEPIIPGKSMGQILAEVNERCAQLLLNELDKMDPTLRLQQLLDRISQACASMNFTLLRSLIDKIQAAKRQIIMDALSKLTDPLSRLAKLHDFLIDAINTGAQDLVNELMGLIKFEQFSQLLSALDKLDPRRAIAFLNAEIARLTALQNFPAIMQLLDAMDYIRNKFAKFTAFTNNVYDWINRLIDEPERLFLEMQRKIREALDLENYQEIRNLISAYDSIRNAIEGLAGLLDPRQLLARALTLLNEAIRKMDLGRYNRIIDELASKLCGQDLGILPELPNVPEIKLPSILA
jgi:hypothetical protein